MTEIPFSTFARSALEVVAKRKNIELWWLDVIIGADGRSKKIKVAQKSRGHIQVVPVL